MFSDENLGGTIVAITTIPFILILGVLIFSMLRSARRAKASYSWPTTTGQILVSNVHSRRSSSSNGTHHTVYEPKIQYEYTVDGKRYQSKQLSYSVVAGTSAESWAQGIVDRYPQGSSVQVYYNSSKPSEAVLEHAGTGGSLALVFILGAVEVLLLVLLVLALTGHFA
ncbi:MAG: DUF3592 domain-containing protein [Chloroflexota bacterium]